MKKLWILPIVAGALAITLMGCQSQSTELDGTEATEGSAVSDALRVGWWGNQVRNDGTVEVINMYMKENPDTKMEYEFSDWGGYWDKLSTQAAGGTMPDILQQDYSRIAQYAESDQLLDLTPYVESGALDLSNVPQSIIDTGKINGKLYGICLGTACPAMVYDKQLVEEAGVTVPMQPTFDELCEIGETIYKKTGAKTLMDGTMTMMSMMARSDGTEIMATLANGDSSIAQKYYEELERFSTPDWAISADLLVEKNPDVIETKPIVDQTTWNDFTFSSMSIGIQKASGKDIGIVMYPQNKDSVNQCMYLKPSMFFSISANSELKDEAVAFLNWFINDVECNKVLKAERGVPISTVIAQETKEILDPISIQVFDFTDEVAKIGTPADPPSCPGFSEVEAKNITMVENIRYGQIDAKTAAEQFVTEAKSILEAAKITK